MGWGGERRVREGGNSTNMVSAWDSLQNSDPQRSVLCNSEVCVLEGCLVDLLVVLVLDKKHVCSKIISFVGVR